MGVRRLLEMINIVSAFPPGDINTDKDGDFVNLKNYEGCLIVIHKAAGTAGDDPSIKLQQATVVAGSDAKALNFNNLYHKIGATALDAIGEFTRVDLDTPTDDLDLVSVNGDDLLADVGESLLVVDVKASDLDVGNGFCCLNVSIEGDDIGNATLAAAFYILYGARYTGAIPKSAIAD